MSKRKEGSFFKRTKLNESAHKVDVFKKPHYDDVIIKEDYHTYLPYTQNTKNSDTIRIEIQSSDIITSTYDSFIKISGTYAPKEAGKVFVISNNAACFLFDEIQLKLGSTEIIDVCKQPGITSFIKGITTYTNNDKNGLSSIGWGENQQVFANNKFACCIPLRHIFGFCEDYRQMLVKMRQELILIRAKSDINCYQSDETDVEFVIDKISWEVPHLVLSDERNLELMEKLRTHSEITMAYRRWELHELPALPASNKTIWRVKNSSPHEKPIQILLCAQKNKMNVRNQHATRLTHANITNIKAHLNSSEYPYQRMNLNFDQNDYIIAFINYKRFQASYYGKSSNNCLLDYDAFKNTPVFVIDCSNQPISLKESPIDIRIEIDSANNFEAGTKLYALILQECVMQYNPFTEIITHVIRD